MASQPGYRSEARWTGPRVADTGPRSPAVLARVIEGEIIPRLLMAHQTDGPRPVAAPIAEVVIGATDVDRLTPLVLTRDAYDLLGHVQQYLARGASVAVVFTDLLAPVARRLGEMWTEDLCDFIEVTMGLWRLQEVVHELSARTPGAVAPAGPPRRALFAPCPGGQHSLGAVMLEELFRRAGWEATGAAADGGGALWDLIEGEPFDLIGLTVACDEQVAALPALIGDIRARARNSAVVVMVGGRVFNDDPALALRVNADGTAANGPQAIAKAWLLVETARRPPLGNA